MDSGKQLKGSNSFMEKPLFDQKCVNIPNINSIECEYSEEEFRIEMISINQMQQTSKDVETFIEFIVSRMDMLTKKVRFKVISEITYNIDTYCPHTNPIPFLIIILDKLKLEPVDKFNKRLKNNIVEIIEDRLPPSLLLSTLI